MGKFFLEIGVHHRWAWRSGAIVLQKIFS